MSKSYILVVFVAVLVEQSTGQSWSACSVTCGRGSQTLVNCNTFFGNCETFTRNCYKRTCPKEPADPTPTPAPVVDPACSKSCGGGRKCRLGTFCTECNTRPCVPEWGKFSTCTKSCGGGTKFKVDPCPLPIEKCIKTYEDCNLQACPRKISCPYGQEFRYGSESSCCPMIGETCGTHYQRNRHQRIFGGDVSMLGEWPWVAVQVAKSTKTAECGGSIIHKRWILSAAHCMRTAARQFSPKDYYILVGTVKISTPTSGHQRHEIRKFYPHEDYVHPLPTADIGLVELESDITFNSQIKPICLPKSEFVPDDTNCVVAGFGFSEHSNGQPSDILRHVSLRVLPFDVCLNALRRIPETKYITRANNLCIGRLSQSKDTCRGDSGSAIACQRCMSCSWYVAATLSYGTGGTQCNTNNPAVYMNVINFQQWIIKKVPISVAGQWRCPT